MNTNDRVQVDPAGRSKTGSSGVTVKAVLDGVTSTNTYRQAFTTIRFFGYGGNDNVQFAGGLTITTAITGADGDDKIGPAADRTPSSSATVTIPSGPETATIR